MQSAVSTSVDTTVTIMDAEGRVIERVPAGEFVKRQRAAGPRSWSINTGRFSEPRPPREPTSVVVPTAEEVSRMDATRRCTTRQKLTKAGLAIPEYLAIRTVWQVIGRRSNPRKLEDLTAGDVATWTYYQRQHYRERFIKAGLPVPAFLAPRKSGPRSVAA